VRFLRDESLRPWLTALMERARVVAPQDEEGVVLFRPLERDGAVVLDRRAAAPAKWVLLPQTEELFRYTTGRDPETGAPTVRHELPGPPPETVVFGLAPCDMRGVDILDKVFLRGRTRDPYYAARRAATAFVVLTCAGPADASCFCHWVGPGPGEAPGADIELVRLEEGWALLAHTQKGEELAGLAAAEEADLQDRVAAAREAALAAMGEAPDLSAAPERFAAAFDDKDFWERAAALCNGCAACTHLCPTCQCFDIADECAGGTGRRLRTWDSCLSATFTLEASGHNPRPGTAERWRNRLGHKFSYHPRSGEGFGCTGCGRCVRACPSCVDIREILCSLPEGA